MCHVGVIVFDVLVECSSPDEDGDSSSLRFGGGGKSIYKNELA
jgi:hypothetical protein